MSAPAFSFGGASATTSFGGASTPAFSLGTTSTPAFSFGSTPAASSAPALSGGFGFGVASTGAGGFSLSGSATSTPAFSLTPASGAAASSAPTFSLTPSSGAATTSAPAFGFGGQPAASTAAPAFNFSTPGTSAPASSAAAAATSSAASAGGFSFGLASSGAAAGGGFSFGGAPASGASVAVPSTTAVTSAPAAASTPAPLFGTGLANTAAASAATSAPAASTAAAAAASSGALALTTAAPASSAPAASGPAASAPAVAAPSAIQGQPVDDIINEWTSELERRSRSFVKHAEALAEWDRAILENRHALLGLEEEFRRVLAGQEALERRLQMLEAHQKGIHEALIGMEGEAERMYREERPLADDEAAERDLLYERAERVGAVLGRVADQLAEAIADVNEVTAASLGDASGPMGKLVRVLNNQLNALTQVEAQTDELSEKLASLQTNGRNGVA